MMLLFAQDINHDTVRIYFNPNPLKWRIELFYVWYDGPWSTGDLGPLVFQSNFADIQPDEKPLLGRLLFPLAWSYSKVAILHSRLCNWRKARQQSNEAP